MSRSGPIGVACLTLAAGCSLALGGSGGEGGRAAARAEPQLHLSVAPVVYWDGGGDRHVELALENGADRTLALAEPDPAYARVAVFPGPDDVRVCGVEPHPPPVPPRAVEIPPGGSIALRVDLSEACAGVPPGDYRYEVDYRSPPAERGSAFSGALATRYGQLRIEGAPAAASAAPERAASPHAGRAPSRR